MKKLLLNRNKRTFAKVFLWFFALVLFSSATIFAQIPKLPILGLGVRENGAQFVGELPTEWYPDNRIWVNRSQSITGGTIINNEVLIPVFMNNTWKSSSSDVFTTDEITSFTFKIYYDGSALEFLDVQSHHPYTKEEAENLSITRFNNTEGVYTTPLAEHFNLSASDEKVSDYLKYFNVNNVDENGRRVSVTGVASTFYNLPTTGPYENLVLLYLRFNVKPTASSSKNYSIYFDPTYICYNGINIAKDQAIRLLKDFPGKDEPGYASMPKSYYDRNDNLAYLATDALYMERYSLVDKMVGLKKYWNFRDPETEHYYKEPYLPGSITLKVMESYPELVFSVYNPSSAKPVNQQIIKDPVDNSTWLLEDLITSDDPVATANLASNRAQRFVDVDITSAQSDYRMEDIIIETDQSWLKIFSDPVAGNNDYEEKFPNNYDGSGKRRAFVQRIDKTVNLLNYDPFPNPSNNMVPKKFRLGIYCDTDGLVDKGYYEGYITFKSPNDKYNPTRILVKFVYFDNALEHNPNIGTVSNPPVPYGITLKVTPFNGTNTNLTKTLIMGSADRATNYADTLFGEFAATQPLGVGRLGNIETFDARFFLDSDVYDEPDKTEYPLLWEEWDRLVKNGFGDFAHSEANPRSNSRDIRASKTNEKSHIYLVKFDHANATTTNFYPVIVEWDTKEFLDNTAIFLKYVANGKEYVVDMRDGATPVGNGKYTFSFNDRNVKEFRIEYTIGVESVSDLVDNFGDPIIMPNGWNLLSLPLKPVNTHHQYVFGNAKNIPFLYTFGQWQQPADGNLQPGIAYFVKYGDQIDKKFTGAPFYKIDRTNYPVKVHKGSNIHIQSLDIDVYKGGWNAIGALSKRIDISSINFLPLPGTSAAPMPDYTLKAGVWAYRTNMGYQKVSALYPGKGYWIRVDEDGFLDLEAPRIPKAINISSPVVDNVAGFDKITVADNSQKSTSVYAGNNISYDNYQLPPLPPREMFDVRFNYDNYATNYDDESIVSLQGVTYPVSVTFENPRANYSVIDPLTGYVYGTVKAGNNENIIINESRTNSFKLVAEIVNETFFVTVAQNPVTSNNAEINFGISQEADITLAIYNSMGNEVINLEYGNIEAGIYNENINITNLSSGSYIVRLIAGNESRTFMMNVVK